MSWCIRHLICSVQSMLEERIVSASAGRQGMSTTVRNRSAPCIARLIWSVQCKLEEATTVPKLSARFKHFRMSPCPCPSAIFFGGKICFAHAPEMLSTQHVLIGKAMIKTVRTGSALEQSATALADPSSHES